MRRENQFLQESVVVTVDHASLTGDLESVALLTEWPFVIDSVKYVNLTGLVEDASNFFELSVLVDSSQVSLYSTETGTDGTIAAGVAVDLTPAAADCYVPRDTLITFLADETGTATLPPGRLIITGRRTDS